MSDREAMKLALKALMVATTPIPADRHKVVGAIKALRAALDAPRPEPLTDEEALRLWAGDVPRPVIGKNKVLAFTRAIERAHNIRGNKP